MARGRNNRPAPKETVPAIVETKAKEVIEPEDIAPEEAPAPKETVPAASYGRRWRACSWLSSKGETIAEPGDELVLSDALSSHYLQAAPGSIEPAEIIH